jgi:hypothetical protein
VLKLLNKLLRLVGYLGFAWALFALFMTFKWATLAGLLLFAVWALKRKPWRGWAHGTARWMTRKEAAPLMKAKHGILLGRLVE